MIEPIRTWRDDIVGFRIGGTTTEVDIKPLLTQLNEKLKQYKKLRLFLEHADPDGFSVDTLMEDFKYNFGHSGNFEKAAIITFKEWLDQADQLAHQLRETQLKSFHYSERDQAIRWIEQ
jgi:hypothetical protein